MKVAYRLIVYFENLEGVGEIFTMNGCIITLEVRKVDHFFSYMHMSHCLKEGSKMLD